MCTPYIYYFSGRTGVKLEVSDYHRYHSRNVTLKHILSKHHIELHSHMH